MKRFPRRGFYLSGRFVTIDFGHHDVHENDSGLLEFKQVYRFLPVGRFYRFVVQLGQQSFQGAAIDYLVVNNQGLAQKVATHDGLIARR